jgi:hypothetical protein
MRQLLIVPVLFLTLMVENPAWGEWKKVGTIISGDLYVDLDRIKQRGGTVYYWMLNDYLRPIGRHLSSQSYQEGNCNNVRWKELRTQWYILPMGKGEPDGVDSKSSEWIPGDDNYGAPLRYVCNFVKNR